jgi:haloacetate dehalogenase
LLHGYPPDPRDVARESRPGTGARHHTVICPDLRGYGASGKPSDVADYSFRHMARDMRALMAELGHERFAVAGHDRGARVAHRLALDAPEAVTRLCLMDIIPTHTLLAELRKDVAASYYHWFFLAQPAPFPETMIGHDPDTFYEACLLGWGGAQLKDFDADQLAAYRAAWHDAETTRGMCNDYRAALIHDFEDDAADLGSAHHLPHTGALWARMARWRRPMTWQSDMGRANAARCRQRPFPAVTSSPIPHQKKPPRPSPDSLGSENPTSLK